MFAKLSKLFGNSDKVDTQDVFIDCGKFTFTEIPPQYPVKGSSGDDCNVPSSTNTVQK